MMMEKRLIERQLEDSVYMTNLIIYVAFSIKKALTGNFFS
jgi:hypothetical protein